MGIYANSYEEENFGVDMEALVEAYLIDDLLHNYSEDTVREFCAPGGVADALLEVGVLKSNRTMVRLSKDNDLVRRKTIACIQMAKQKNDPLYHKLVKHQVLRKQTKAKIIAKYGNKAARVALIGQKEYLKTMRGVNLSNSGSGAFITDDPNRKG